MSPTDIELFCPECDYNLTGAPGDRCPWCGWNIEVEELIAAAKGRGSGNRYGVMLAAFFVGAGSLVALYSLYSRSRAPAFREGFAVLAVVAASLGHLALLALAGLRKKWPLRDQTAGEMLRLVGWFSIAAAVFGASSACEARPTPLFVRGVSVTGVFEFVAAAFLFCLPGVTLLGLRWIAFAAGIPASARRLDGSVHKSSVAGPVPFAMVIAQRFGQECLSQSWSRRELPRSVSSTGEIARIWEAELAVARESNRRLFNGPLIRLDRATVRGKFLHFELGTTCYRDFLSTNLQGLSAAARTDPPANPLGISAVVVTRDGYLVLGRRNETVAYHAGFLHTFGGLVEVVDRLGDGNVDVFRAIRRELREELAVADEEILGMVITGIVRDREIRQPELLFDARLSLSRPEVADRFDAAARDQEHSSWEFVRDEPDAVVPFLRRASPIAPVAEAAVLLHGRHEWGVEWFENSCFVLYGDVPENVS